MAILTVQRQFDVKPHKVDSSGLPDRRAKLLYMALNVEHHEEVQAALDEFDSLRLTPVPLYPEDFLDWYDGELYKELTS